MSESSRADWSTAMVCECIDHGNDVTCHAEPVELFLVFRKNINVIQCKKTNRPQFSIVHILIEHRNDAIKCSKLCGETTRLLLVVLLEF